MRAGVVETVKEGDSKAPSFSRDLCEIPAMPRVKKKTVPRYVPTTSPLVLPSVPPPLSPFHIVASSLWKWKWLEPRRSAAGNLPLSEAFSGGTGKKERPRRTDLSRPALEVICRDTVINANRKIAGTTGCGLEERGRRRAVRNFFAT